MTIEDNIINKILQPLRKQQATDIDRSLLRGLSKESLSYIKRALQNLENKGIIKQDVRGGVSEDIVPIPLMAIRTDKTFAYLDSIGI